VNVLVNVNVNGNVPEAKEPNGFGYVYEHEHVHVGSLKSSPEWEVLRPPLRTRFHVALPRDAGYFDRRH
jgi:hypothetical protein